MNPEPVTPDSIYRLIMGRLRFYQLRMVHSDALTFESEVEDTAKAIYEVMQSELRAAESKSRA